MVTKHICLLFSFCHQSLRRATRSKPDKFCEILRFSFFYCKQQFLISNSYKQVQTLRLTRLATASISRPDMKRTMHPG